MKNTFNYLINSRILTTLHPIEHELDFKSDKNYLFDLTYLGVLDIHGDNAHDFLQGQITCDLNKLTNKKAAQGAFCNLKGRIMALVDLISWQGIKLILPRDLIDQTEFSLSKVAMLSRVTLKENKDLRIFGLYMQKANQMIPAQTNESYSQIYTDDLCCYHLSDCFYIYVVATHFVDQLICPFKEQDLLLGSLTWHSTRLKNNCVDIYPNSRGLFLPHRLGLHLQEYISFNKGCYKGQEIIARMHYKSTIKHELKQFTINTNQPIYSGQKILEASTGKEVGELVDYSILNLNNYLLVASVLKEYNDPITLG